MKMKDSGRDKEVAQPKNGAAIQGHSKTNSNSPADKTEALEKGLERARKDKKKKAHKNRRERQKRSMPATRSNIELPSGKKQKDFSHITCFSCNKKAHYPKDCTVLKAKN